MLSLNEKVVYPGHGVAQINRIIEKKIATQTTPFYELKFLNKDMTILVPVSNAKSVGIRRLSSNEGINRIFKMLTQPIQYIHHETVVTNWNKRNKEYQGKLRTGDLGEICTIYRDLRHVETQKELSFGEKNLLNQTEALLVEEIAIVKKIGKEKAIEQIRSLVNAPQQHVSEVTQNL